PLLPLCSSYIYIYIYIYIISLVISYPPFQQDCTSNCNLITACGRQKCGARRPVCRKLKQKKKRRQLTCSAESFDCWTRPDLKTEKYVFLQRGSQPVTEYQLSSFQDRVDLVDRQMKDGNVSLILKNVTREDTGRYECRVVQRGTNRRKRSYLNTEPISIIDLDVHSSGESVELSVFVCLCVCVWSSSFLVVGVRVKADHRSDVEFSHRRKLGNQCSKSKSGPPHWTSHVILICHLIVVEGIVTSGDSVHINVSVCNSGLLLQSLITVELCFMLSAAEMFSIFMSGAASAFLLQYFVLSIDVQFISVTEISSAVESLFFFHLFDALSSKVT
uniref:Ig-like domain-containing protein n=1 Tax=Lates calcarifer TaxID=8187 RepID=A0A4W6D4Q7_LATCA